MYPPSFPAAVTDSPDIVVLVERALEKDEQIKGAALDILAREGTVVLMGTVAEELTKAAAERVARSVPGVSDVTNLIIVDVGPD